MTSTSSRAALLCTLLALSPIAIGACSAGIRVHTASLSTAPFGEYKTFSFAPTENAPAGFRASPRQADVARRAQPMITALLQEKGYALAAGKGDFVVAFGAGRREVEREHATPARPEWLDEDENDDFVEGSLVLDIFDGSSDGQVWHGASRTAIDPDKPNDALLRTSLQQMLAPFPIAKTKAAFPSASR